MPKKTKTSSKRNAKARSSLPRGSPKKSDTDHKVNLGKPWVNGTPRMDTHSGFCWIINERGHVVGSFQLSDADHRPLAEVNRAEGERFFKKYYPKEASASLANAEVSDGGPLTHESTETRTRRSLH